MTQETLGEQIVRKNVLFSCRANTHLLLPFTSTLGLVGLQLGSLSVVNYTPLIEHQIVRPLTNF